MPLACQYCQSTDVAEHCTGRDILHGLTSESFQYYRCRQCGSIFRHVDSSERLDQYYPADYGPYEQTETVRSEPSVATSTEATTLAGTNREAQQSKPHKPGGRPLQSRWQKNLRKRWKYFTSSLEPIPDWRKSIREYAKYRRIWLQQRLNRGEDDLYSVAASFLSPGSSVCDYGCGSSRFLKNLQARVPSINGTGVDFVAHDAGSFEQAGLIFLTTEEFWQHRERYHMINMNHVIEHIPDPTELLKRLITKLQPNGILLITTPNARNPWALLFRTSWFPLDCPRHINIPTLKSIETVAWRSGYVIKAHQVQFRYNDFSRSFFQRHSLESQTSYTLMRRQIYDHSKPNKQQLAHQKTRDSLIDLVMIQAWAICSSAFRPFGFSDRIIIELSPINGQT